MRSIICSFQRRFPFVDILFRFGDIRDQVAKLSEICPKIWRSGDANFMGEGQQISDRNHRCAWPTAIAAGGIWTT